ncbi:MAG: hypothetical protein HZA81_04325 [Candidatus Taylorbacteria bacterium]|nr:hypothetical protein [Candidatus Taylorbacteria bacterium]
MKKSVLTKITASILALSFVIPASLAALPPKPVYAQGQGKAGACIVGLLTAIGVSTPAWVKEIIGVSDGSGDTLQDTSTNAAVHSASFNSCILQPLAKIMIVSLIRNIGSSIVNWVNSGFEGSPTFVTDFEGTLLDAADQAVGTFIEGTELGFLCNDFGFQIRIALALKYSRPFRERARCTASQIGNNIATNGGQGWDNWLSLTTEPQNNVYGAYVIADGELAERAARAAGIKQNKLALGQGFLDIPRKCAAEDLETEAEAKARVEAVKKSGGKEGGVQVQKTNLNADAFGTYSLDGKQTSAPTSATKTQTIFSTSEKPICKKQVTQTPGYVIASKLNSTLAQGDIQAAVAQEIDDVIAATMNQLAQKAIQGAYGLLGMSKKSSASQSYYNKYQNQYYGAGGTTATGATSPAEDYQVRDFDAAADLVQNDAGVQDIYKATDIATNKAVAQQQAQQELISDNFSSEEATEQNYALLKPASQSSFGGGSANNAVNGNKDGNVTQYNQPAISAEEENPWWEVDLGAAKAIKEVRIWRVANKPASETLGSIRVVASDGASQNAWASDSLSPADSSPNPTIVPVGQTRRYVRIEKQGQLDDQCRVTFEFRGEREYESCYHPLELIEVEVIGNVSVGSTTPISGGSGSSSSGSSSTVQDDGRTATSTLAWLTSSPTSSIANGSSQGYELRLTAEKPISSGNELTIKSNIKRNGSRVSYLSVFSTMDFAYGREGEQISIFAISPENDSGSFELSRVTQSNPAKYYLFRQKAQSIKVGAPAGTYTIETTVEDKFGTVLKTATGNFVVQ